MLRIKCQGNTVKWLFHFTSLCSHGYLLWVAELASPSIRPPTLRSGGSKSKRISAFDTSPLLQSLTADADFIYQPSPEPHSCPSWGNSQIPF